MLCFAREFLADVLLAVFELPSVGGPPNSPTLTVQLVRHERRLLFVFAGNVSPHRVVPGEGSRAVGTGHADALVPLADVGAQVRLVAVLAVAQGALQLLAWGKGTWGETQDWGQNKWVVSVTKHTLGTTRASRLVRRKLREKFCSMFCLLSEFKFPMFQQCAKLKFNQIRFDQISTMISGV